MRKPTPSMTRFVLTTLALVLAACGTTGDAQVGGSLTGLGTGQRVTVQNNGADALTLTANQSFEFPTRVASGGAYNVTVLTQPTGQSCSVTNGTGTVNGAADNVTDVVVTCANTATLAGTLSGLASGTGVTLVNSGVTLALAANGAFAFPGALANGTAYNVTVMTQPVGQTCTVTKGSGVVDTAVAVDMTVQCA